MKEKIVEKQDLDKKILEASSNFEVPSKLTKSQAWDKLEKKIDFGNTSKVIQMTVLRWAASVAILIGLSFFMLDKLGMEEFVANDDIEEIVLPDGSTITLNQNSSISYNTFFWSLNRNINLTGQAYFDVEKGNTFKVSTRNGEVKVLGTEFDIVESKDKFEVFCFEGKVAVKSNEEAEVFLAAGMATVLENKTLSRPFTFNMEKIAAWKNGLFYFEKESLSSVFLNIENHYKVDIIINTSIEDKDFSGVFKKGDIETVMEIVCSSMGLSYVQKDNKIIVTE